MSPFSAQPSSPSLPPPVVKLDEFSLRRPSFIDGAPIELCDGQEWTFPVVKARFLKDSTRPSGVRAKFVVPDGAYGLTFDRYQQLIDAAEKAKTGLEIISTQLDVAIALIQVNYDLTEEQISDLIQFSLVDNVDPFIEEMQREIMGVAFGQGPKR